MTETHPLTRARAPDRRRDPQPALPPEMIGRGELAAVGASILWIVISGLFFVFAPAAPADTPFDSLRFVMVLLAIFLPAALFWVAAAAARSSRVMREESRRLHAAIDALRETYVADRAGQGLGTSAASVEKKLNEIAQSARQTESVLATFASSRAGGTPPPRTPLPDARKPIADPQPSLAFGTSAEDLAPPLSREDTVRALNFPDNDKDETGFAALRRALRDRTMRQLIQAAQDVLTLLSQDGIYMDDLRPDRARPELWRRFAKGERGRTIAQLGGIRDRSCLALASARMREDTIFRDTAHHFLRLFDRQLAAFEPEATDEDLAHFSETRTARAFMLLGRVTGAFD